jgi:hypothetical protein
LLLKKKEIERSHTDVRTVVVAVERDGHGPDCFAAAARSCPCYTSDGPYSSTSEGPCSITTTSSDPSAATSSIPTSYNSYGIPTSCNPDLSSFPSGHTSGPTTSRHFRHSTIYAFQPYSFKPLAI